MVNPSDLSVIVQIPLYQNGSSRRQSDYRKPKESAGTIGFLKIAAILDTSA
jgi:hypothetical protein